MNPHRASCYLHFPEQDIAALRDYNRQMHEVFVAFYSDMQPKIELLSVQFGIPVGTVKSRIHRARQFMLKLRRQREPDRQIEAVHPRTIALPAGWVREVIFEGEEGAQES